MENENQVKNPQPSKGNIDWGGDVQRFFAEDLKDMFVNIVMKPFNGAQKWLSETRSKSIVNPLCTIVLSFVVATLIPFLFMLMRGKLYSSMFKFGACIVHFGLLPLFFALFMTIFMFIYLAIKQKPDIMLAFRNSAIHVFLMTIAIVLVSLMVLIFGGNALAAGFSFLPVKGASASFGSIMSLLVLVYAFALGISAVRQVLTANTSNEKDGKDVVVWFVAPFIIILSFWLSQLIVCNM